MARNFARFGPINLHFAQILSPGDYNFHFLPLFTLIWSAFFGVFGVANWVSRFMAATFSLAAVAVFYQLARRYFSLRVAVMGAIFWLATPMFIYFGKMPVHEIPLMFFVLAALYFYLGGRDRLMFFFIILAELTTWPGFFLVPAITIHYFLFGRHSGKRSAARILILLWFVSFVLFGLHLTHDYLVTGSFFGGGLAQIFFQRVGGVPLVPYLTTLAHWAWTYYSFLIPLSLVGLFLVRRRDILLLLLTYALFYPIIFRDAAFRHDYLLIYFWPFLALSSALAVNRLFSKKPVLIFSFLAIVVGMVALRFQYILALENSDLYRDSVVFGQYIHDHTAPADRIRVVTADPNVPWDGWFIGYYADRPIVFSGFNKTATYSPGGKMTVE